MAIPVAASIQILIREYVDLRTLSIKPEPHDPPPAPAADPASRGSAARSRSGEHLT